METEKLNRLNLIREMEAEMLRQGFRITVFAEPEYSNPGDCMDDECAEMIREDMKNSSSEWIWCCACVEIEAETVKGSSVSARTYLGCCNYENEIEFKLGGYYTDMVYECLEQLTREIADERRRLASLVETSIPIATETAVVYMAKLRNLENEYYQDAVGK